MNAQAPINQLVPAEERDGPSLFVGVRYVTDEITKCALSLQGHKFTANVRSMNECMEHQRATALKVALENIASDCDDIAKIAMQMKLQAKRTAEIVGNHLNRRPRV